MKCIIRQTKSVLLILTMITLLVTCESPDPPSTFTKPAETRLSEAVNTYYDALCNSQEGWTLQYEDSTRPLGRYSFAMKFKKSGEVEVISDIPSQSDIRVGYYTLAIGNTVELSFSTYTQLHYLTDPEMGIDSKGLGAGFGFLLTDISADGNTITMRQRAGKHKFVYLKKITSSFQEVKDRYDVQVSMIARLSLSPAPARDPSALFLVLKSPRKQHLGILVYTPTSRTLIFYFSLAAQTKIGLISRPVRINQEGFSLINNKLPADFPLRDLNFIWDDAQNFFINSESYTIEYGRYMDLSSAESINRKYSAFRSEFLRRYRYTHLVWRKDDPSLIEVFDESSPEAQALLTDSIKYISVNFLSNTTQAVVKFLNTGRDFARFDTFAVVYPKPVTGGALFVHKGTGYSSTDAETHFTTTPSGQHANALSDLFAAPEGLLIEPEGKLSGSSNRTYAITFFKNPRIYFVAYGFSK